MGRKIPRTLPWLLISIAVPTAPSACAHDIPNQRVDRSIQATLYPGRLQIDYEVGLTELTLTQDLRALVGTRPGAERSDWLALYGQVTGPLNAKGFLVSVDGVPVIMTSSGYSLSLEEHPRYTFHLEAIVPFEGRLSIRDMNFVSSEGTSRLAIRGLNAVVLEGNDGPPDVEKVPIRPVWELSDSEERRTKQIEIRYHLSHNKEEPSKSVEGVDLRNSASYGKIESRADPTPQARSNRRFWGLSFLFDDGSHFSTWLLVIIALGLGAAHAIQPGHGKTLVAAIALGPSARLYQPVLLGLATAVAHLSSVLLLALILWYTGSSRVSTLHEGLMQVTGFVIASTGFWRLGRNLAGYGEHEVESFEISNRGDWSLIGLGLVGGLVPCWDAVGLLVLAAALGRLAAGVVLVLAFCTGMAAVLVLVGCIVWRVKSAAIGREGSPAWQPWLGILCGGFLSIVGLWIFLV